MNERTYHKVLSSVVHKLLHPLLAVLTPHMRLYKQLNWTRPTSKRQCAWSPNHEFVGSGCRRWTVSAVRTALRSRAQYMPSIFPPR